MATKPSTSREDLQGAMACSRDVPNDKPEPKQDCGDVVNLSAFLVGTENGKGDLYQRQQSQNRRGREAVYA